MNTNLTKTETALAFCANPPTATLSAPATLVPQFTKLPIAVQQAVLNDFSMTYGDLENWTHDDVQRVYAERVLAADAASEQVHVERWRQLRAAATKAGFVQHPTTFLDDFQAEVQNDSKGRCACVVRPIDWPGEQGAVLLVHGSPTGAPLYRQHAVVYAWAQPRRDNLPGGWDLLQPWNVFWSEGKEVVAIAGGAQIRKDDGVIFIGERALYAIDVLADFPFKPWIDVNGWLARADISPSLAEVMADAGAPTETVDMLRQPHGDELLASLRPSIMGDDYADLIFDDHWSVIGEREDNRTCPHTGQASIMTTSALCGFSAYR